MANAFLRPALAVLAAVYIAECRSTEAAAANQRPFPQHVAYPGAVLQPSAYTAAQRDTHVRAFYNEWKRRYVVAAGRNADGNRLYRIALGKIGTTSHATTVSEGQGWGAVILATMAGHDASARAIFDGLIRFAEAFPSAIEPRLMSWRILDGKPVQGRASAFDGDADLAYGLLLADAQWGSRGTIDYLAEARRRLAGMLAATIGPASRLPLLGDWVEVGGAKYNQWTFRTSDLMPSHFDAFRKGSGKATWATVARRSRQAVTTLQAGFSPGPGLLPDFVQPVSAADHSPRPASADFLEGPWDGAYNYNACRVPLRIGLDALLGNVGASLRAARRISRWAATVTGGNPSGFDAGWRLNGVAIPGRNYLSTAFVAPLGVAAMVTPGQQAWLDAIYELTRTTKQDYFEDTIALLSLLIMSGNLWAP